MTKVLFVGDSRKMKGGISSVMKTIEASYIWKKYQCYWLETQVNDSTLKKLLYLFGGIVKSIFRVPFYDVVFFQTSTGTAQKSLLPIFLYSLLWRKKIIIELHVGNQLRNFQDDKLFRFWCNKSDKVVVLGKTWMEYVPIDDKTKVTYLYNPSPDVENQVKHEKYFLFAAYLDIIYKAYDTLIEGWSIFAKSHPEWKLVVCGSGEIDNLKRIINECDVEDSVVLPGWVSGDVRLKYFKEAYAYVMTSKMEGLPMSILESMAYGVPVITTPVGCLPEFLEHDKSALIFDFKDAEGLAVQMERIVKDTDKRMMLVQNAHELCKNNFVKERFTERLEQIINDTI